MDHYFTNNENLKSEIRSLNYSYHNCDLIFFSDNGVFSKNEIDYGSKFLLETFLDNYNLSGNILDVGCGYGFIGITLAKVLNSKVTMIDINKRAIHLCKMNIEKNKVNAIVKESNIYENVDDKYKVIISNPPVRAGKKVLLEILENAKDYLVDDGQLWYVLRKDHGAKSTEKTLEKYYEINNIKKSKGFYVFQCKKRLT